MNITYMRIDDRLIHGQIITAWVNTSHAQLIIVADDKAANDEMQQMLLKLAVPGSIDLKIMGISEAASFLKADESNTKALLLVRNPKTAFQLIDEGFSIESINVGNISNSRSDTGRTKILSYLYLEEEDANNLIKLSEKNIKLDVRSVPTDKSQDAVKLIDKYFNRKGK